MENNNYYVYQFLREDGSPYYIGKGKDLRAFITSNRTVPAPVNIENIQIISDNLSEKDAFELEILLISKYGRKDLGTGILRNLTNGGDGTSGRIATETHRMKMSQKKSGDLHHMYGKKHTEETKIKMRNSHKGKKCAPMSEDHRKKLSLAKTGSKMDDTTKMKISLANKGRKPWNTGKHLSDDHKQKLSVAGKCRILTEEHKRKIGEAQKGEKNHMFGKRGKRNPKI